jgi:hypothetical protein
MCFTSLFQNNYFRKLNNYIYLYFFINLLLENNDNLFNKGSQFFTIQYRCK